VRVGEHRIHVRLDDPPGDHHPTEQTTLLLIHGTAASSRSWQPLVPLLTPAHRVVRVDLPGCGESALPAATNYAVDDIGSLLGTVLERLELAGVVAVGHSSGGVFAVGLAQQRPDLVRALTVIDTGPDMSAYIAEDIDLRGVPWTGLTDEQLRLAMRDGFHPGYRIPQDYVDQFRELDFGVFGAVSASIREYLASSSLPQRLVRLGKPLLVIFGDQDQRWDPASADDYLVVDGAKVQLLNGLGHSPNLEDPARVAALLLDFGAR
jgi:pimeloyl-ACP methyl ester carboxylesterase